MSTLTKGNVGISAETERSLKSFIELFGQFMSDQPEKIKTSQEQRSIIADTIILWLEEGGFTGNLPFSYGEAYLSVGIPKEFLRR
jgi:hypothetical protein